MRDDFAVIIISHGRPDCETVKTLKGCGYTGKMFVLVDDEDKTLSEYKARYGDSLCIFTKEENFDIGDNFGRPNTIATFARNECWNVADEKKLKYFLMLDDDLKSISIRYEDDGSLRGKSVKDADKVFEAVCEFMDNTPVACTGFGLPIDYIGGVFSTDDRHIMNAYVLRVSERFDFKGRYSEDTITPVLECTAGKIFQKIQNIQMVFDVWTPQKKTKAGGCQEAYRDNDSYVLRFYAVMFAPSCVVVRPSKNEGWDNTTKYHMAFPKIVSERLKKA